MRLVRLSRLALAFLGAWLGTDEVTAGVRGEETAFLFTYFIGNGEDGLHLATSTDGLRWEALGGGKSFLRPEIGSKERLMRDPCAVRGPDGTYHLVWTSGWWEKGIGYASTRDFVTWTPQREIPVMAHEPEARNSWAPEIYHDAATGVFTVFWSTTLPGRFSTENGVSEDALNHRIFATTTRDFVTYSPTELFYDPGFSCIDATYVRHGDDLWWIIKDETKAPEAKKHLRSARVNTATGGIGPLGQPFTPHGVWVEGPTGIKIGDYSYLYYDIYADKHYGVMRTKDFVTWEDVSAQLVFPDEGTPRRVRHGTILEVPRSLIENLRAGPIEPRTH